MGNVSLLYLKENLSKKMLGFTVINSSHFSKSSHIVFKLGTLYVFFNIQMNLSAKSQSTVQREVYCYYVLEMKLE